MSTTSSFGSGAGQSSTDVARDQAGQVGRSAGEAAGQVAQTGKEQAREVATEAKHQARNLAQEAKSQANEQAGVQRDRLVGTLRSFGDELDAMARGEGGQSGLATEVARQVAGRTRDAAGFLDGKDPTDLLEELKSYARRRPGAFLLGAAVAGLVAGRLTRGAKAATSGPSGAEQQPRGAYDSGLDSTGSYTGSYTGAAGGGGGVVAGALPGEAPVTTVHGRTAEGERMPATGPLAETDVISPDPLDPGRVGGARRGVTP